MKTDTLESIERFKTRILQNLEDVDLLFEIAYCWKRCHVAIGTGEWSEDERYYSSCYTFLKGVADYQGIKTVV